ncbi:MAG: RIP metalloprotease RseP [Rhodoferax sp.]|uniref:RIP metalloprotease RseP n=1 Tax=Rhodoferax sp. TaxID=50421 RepID=UPI00271C46FB|nr:RIP metalloprotease RseP [Rhodoferax sp.]MDO8448028.1 RIP metalloprotease RseP [Rhodoferax sp.]
MMLTLAAFVLALGLLIAVHEYGHYRMAVACGVKVLRFSIGFGKPLVRWQPKGSATEFVIAAFPLGGFVKMLDEREAPVADAERHLAFNTQPLRSRVAIVAAGPVANLLLAVVLYAAVNWSGMQLPAPILARPDAGSIAEHAGLIGGERIQRAGFDGGQLQDVESFEDLRWFLTRGALEGQDVRLVVTGPARGTGGDLLLKLSDMDASEANADLFRKIGVVGPFTRPVIGEIVVGAAADKAGLRDGDVVRQVGSVPVVDGQQLRQLIRSSVLNGQAVSAVWKITRAGTELEVTVTPETRQDGALLVGRIGAYVGAMPELVTVKYGVADGLWRGMVRTWDVSVLTLRMMGKMVIGEASLKNLSGPLTIADYAGKSAGMGLTQYLLFLALISVSLGVLNLLPLPVLDGGHLMYYLWEGIMGKPVPDAWMERLQRGGVAVLLVMMSIALFNDITRLFG